MVVSGRGRSVGGPSHEPQRCCCCCILKNGGFTKAVADRGLLMIDFFGFVAVVGVMNDG